MSDALYINGEWREGSGARFESTDPASGEVREDAREGAVRTDAPKQARALKRLQYLFA